MQPPVILNAKECAECKIPKDWGHEIIFENNEKYCGKLLIFKEGFEFSMHYHLLKDEAWYVQGRRVFISVDRHPQGYN